MCPIASLREPLLASFSGIGLDELDARADLLTRLESKYVVTIDVLKHLLEESRGAYDVLDIGGRRDFGYATRYYDDERYSSYHAHHQGRRRRYKIRTRTYMETGMSFLEFKWKWQRGMTVKRRLPCSAGWQDALDAEALEAMRHTHRQVYGQELPRLLRPALDVQYRRVTLAARDGTCRITIDFGLTFVAGARRWRSASHAFVVEVKSARRTGGAHALFRTLAQHPLRHLSKYCVGLATAGVVQNHRFRTAASRLGLTQDSEQHGDHLLLTIPGADPAIAQAG